MSDEAVSQPEDTVSRAEFNMLQEQLKATRVERDREKFEKSEIVAKANAFAKERDEAKEQLASVLSERDKMIGDIVSDHEKALADAMLRVDALIKEKGELANKLGEAERRIAEAGRRADESASEIARLQHEVAHAPSADPLLLLWKLVTQKTQAAHDWLRSKIAPDSPILLWFDKIVAVSLQVGWTAVKLGRDLIAWATPKALELSKKGVAKLEELLAKK
jgi:seryl-tRNA synthetase